ncbi:MAG: hypothetical protein ACXWC9_01065 [Pseudobdellovibrionaceae bacterium]
MVRIVVGALLIVSLGSHAVAGKPSLLEFRDETIRHRARVVQTSHVIYMFRKAFFPALSSLRPEVATRIITVYMSLHDLPKTMTRFELEKYGYKGQASLLKQLYGIWGKDFGDSKPSFIQDLNILEDRIKTERMAVELASLDPALRQAVMAELHTIELASDITDTKIFRTKELNFIRWPFAAEKFLRDIGQPLAADLSRWYESRFYPMAMPSCRKAHR